MRWRGRVLGPTLVVPVLALLGLVGGHTLAHATHAEHLTPAPSSAPAHHGAHAHHATHSPAPPGKTHESPEPAPFTSGALAAACGFAVAFAASKVLHRVRRVRVATVHVPHFGRLLAGPEPPVPRRVFAI